MGFCGGPDRDSGLTRGKLSIRWALVTREDPVASSRHGSQYTHSTLLQPFSQCRAGSLSNRSLTNSLNTSIAVRAAPK